MVALSSGADVLSRLRAFLWVAGQSEGKRRLLNVAPDADYIFHNSLHVGNQFSLGSDPAAPLKETKDL